MRTRRAWDERARQGRPHVSGQRPFGLTVRLDALEPAEADLIRDAAARVLAGTPLYALVVEWNRAAITTSAGKPWRTFTLSRMLQSPHLAGLRVHRGEVVGRGTWPPVLADDHDEAAELHTRLKALLSDPSRSRGGGGGRARYLLSGGILRCDLCGAQMMSRPRADRRRRYICRSEPGTPGCGHVGILAEPLEDLVRDVVLAALAGPGLARALSAAAASDEAQAALLDQLRADEEELTAADSPAPTTPATASPSPTPTATSAPSDACVTSLSANPPPPAPSV